MSLPDHDKKLAYIGQPLPPQNIAPKWLTPCGLTVGDIQRHIAAEWLQIAQ